MAASKIYIKNRKAYYQYEITDKFTAGLQLLGTEIKSLRESKASITEGYCFVKNGEVFIRNMTIEPYSFGSHTNHEPKRERKLLLSKVEIAKIEKKLKDKGITLVPLSLYITSKGWAKLDIGIGKGKKTHDKRETIKDRENKRDLDRAKKI